MAILAQRIGKVASQEQHSLTISAA